MPDPKGKMSGNMHPTALAPLIANCVLQVLDKSKNEGGKNLTEEHEADPTKPYDNAYFFVLFVMFFYSFLALTVFFGYVRKKQVPKTDPYQEFIEDRNRSQKWNTARPVEKYDFEEECIL